MKCVDRNCRQIVAEALNLANATQVYRVDRLRSADGLPIAYDCTWLALRFGVLLTEDSLAHETIYHILETYYGIPIEAGTFHITAAMVTAKQADLLDVPIGASLLVIRRITYTTGNVPVYVQERYYRPDRVSYRISLRRHSGETMGDAASLREPGPVFNEQSHVSTQE
jgi:GntR family transcriptional regulator